jgi:hypothetical protein
MTDIDITVTVPETTVVVEAALVGPKGDTGNTGATGATGASGPGYAGITSTSNVSIATGIKTFTLTGGNAGAFVAGIRARAVHSDTPTYFIEGPITYVGSGTLIINADRSNGSGSHNNWNFSLVGEIGATGATGATGAQGPSGVISVTAPITNSGTSTAAQLGIDQSGLTLTQSQVTGLTTALAGKASTTHASTHASGGSDAITIAESQVTNLVADLAARPLAITEKAFNGTPSTAVDVFPRWALPSTGAQGLSQGTELFTFFSPLATFTASAISIANSAALVIGTGGTITGIRMALYSVDASDNATLIAATASDTTLFNTASSINTRSLAAGTVSGVSVPATITLTAGNRYAVGVLFWGTTGTGFAQATIIGMNANLAALSTLTPRLSGTAAGLTDVAASRTSYTATSQVMWARLT